MSSECCDVIVVHSPPIFTGHRNAQPNLQTAVCIYNNIRLAVTQQQSSPVPVRRYVSSNSRGSSSASSSSTRSSSDSKSLQSVGQQNLQTAKPRRPCLVTRADSESSIGSSSSGSSSDENEPHSPIRRKKKVVFADDRGLSLTQVSIHNLLMSVTNYVAINDIIYLKNRSVYVICKKKLFRKLIIGDGFFLFLLQIVSLRSIIENVVLKFHCFNWLVAVVNIFNIP